MRMKKGHGLVLLIAKLVTNHWILNFYLLVYQSWSITIYSPTNRKIPIIKTYYKDELHGISDEVNDFFVKEKDNLGQLHYNYTPKRLDIVNQEAVTIGYDVDGMCAYTSLQSREVFGPNAVRCYSRLYKKPFYRYDGDHIPVDILNHQISAAKKLGYEWCFISRKYPARHVMRKSIPIYENMTGYKWDLSEEIHLVCDNISDKGCWQDICYTCIAEEPDDFFLLKNVISLEDYKSLS